MIALLDANVLFPPTLRDMLMWLAVTLSFEPRWTESIHNEWICNVLKSYPDIRRDKLERTKTLMNQIDPNCLVIGYDQIIPTLFLPDENDRHVLAAAIQSHVEVIVTYNAKDFPDDILGLYRIRAIHPDTFLTNLFDENTPRFLLAIKKQITAMQFPSKTVDEYLISLIHLKLHEISNRLKEYKHLL